MGQNIIYHLLCIKIQKKKVSLLYKLGQYKNTPPFFINQNNKMKVKNKSFWKKNISTGLSRIVNRIAQKGGLSNRLKYLIDLMVVVNIL